MRQESEEPKGLFTFYKQQEESALGRRKRHRVLLKGKSHDVSKKSSQGVKKSQKNATSKKKQPVLRLEPVEAKLVLEADACTRFLKSVVRAGAVKPDIKSMSCPKRDEQINQGRIRETHESEVDASEQKSELQLPMDQNSLDDHPATEVILRKMSSKESLHKHTSKGMSQNLNEAQSLRSLELSAKDTKTKLANLSVSRSFLDKLKFLETKSKGDYLKNPEQCSHNFYLPKSLLEKDEQKDLKEGDKLQMLRVSSLNFSGAKKNPFKETVEEQRFPQISRSILRRLKIKTDESEHNRGQFTFPLKETVVYNSPKATCSIAKINLSHLYPPPILRSQEWLDKKKIIKSRLGYNL